MDKESSDQNSGISRVKRRRTRAERDRLHSSTASNTAVTARKSETTKETSIDLLNMKDVKNVQSSKNVSAINFVLLIVHTEHYNFLCNGTLIMLVG